MQNDVRLIDANALDDELRNEYLSAEEQSAVLTARGAIIFNAVLDRVRCMVMSAATIDAVPVVRCRDCECSTCIGSPWNVHCVQYDIDVPNDGFCYKAERK